MQRKNIESDIQNTEPPRTDDSINVPLLHYLLFSNSGQPCEQWKRSSFIQFGLKANVVSLEDLEESLGCQL